jgi:hypothetical protein
VVGTRPAGTSTSRALSRRLMPIEAMAWLSRSSLIVDGLREAKVRDRDTRLRIALGTTQASRLWRLLGDVLTRQPMARSCSAAP